MHLINQINGPKISDLPNKYSGKNALNINLGSGNNNFDKYLNIDLGLYKNVDLVSDICNLPIKNSSVKLIACNSVFEHIENTEKAIMEVHRILQKKGIFYLCIPFMCARHHEVDYRRWTSYGIKKALQKKFTIIESGPCRGVGYGLISYVNGIIDYSFKNKILKKLFLFLWKYFSLPLYLIRNDNSELCQSLSNTIYVVAQKK